MNGIAAKRGGDREHVALADVATVDSANSIDLLDLDWALAKLAEQDPRKCRLVELRFFGGLSMEEAAGALAISIVTAYRDWAYARAWLHREIMGGAGG